MKLLSMYQYQDTKLYKFIYGTHKNNKKGYILYSTDELLKAETNIVTENFSKVEVNNYDFT